MTALALHTTSRAAGDSRWAASRAGQHEAGTPVSLGRSLCGSVLTGPQPVVLADVAHCADPKLRELARGWGVRGYLGVALMGPDGRRLGSLAGLSTSRLASGDRDWVQLLQVQGAALQPR